MNSTRKIAPKEQTQSQQRKKLTEQASQCVNDLQTLDWDLLAALNKKRDLDISKNFPFLQHSRLIDQLGLLLALHFKNFFPKIDEDQLHRTRLVDPSLSRNTRQEEAQDRVAESVQHVARLVSHIHATPNGARQTRRHNSGSD